MARLHLNQRTREYLREVGTIVLGVLVALAFGEVADAIRHRVNAQRALSAVRKDIADNTSTLEVRALAERCIRSRLALVADELQFARRTGQLRDIGEIGFSPMRTFRIGNWNSAVDNGDSLYMNPELVASLTDYFETLDRFRSLRAEAALNWGRLAVLVHAPGRIDDNTLASSRWTLAELKYQTDNIDRIATLLFERQKALGVPITYLPFNGKPSSREQVIGRSREAAICQPFVVNGKVKTVGG